MDSVLAGIIGDTYLIIAFSFTATASDRVVIQGMDIIHYFHFHAQFVVVLSPGESVEENF